MKLMQEKQGKLIEICTKKESMIVLFLCGVLIFVILLPIDDNTSYSNEKSDTAQEYEVSQSAVSYKEMREMELKEFLESVSGVGEVRVLIYFGDAMESIPTIEGIVIAAQGAKDESVRLMVVRLVMALYGVEANMVEVTALTS